MYWSIFSIIIILCNIYYFYQFERRVQSVGQWPHCADQSPRSREGHSLFLSPSLEQFSLQQFSQLQAWKLFLPFSLWQFSPQKFYPLFLVLSSHLLFGEIVRTNNKGKSWQIQGQNLTFHLTRCQNHVLCLLCMNKIFFITFARTVFIIVIRQYHLRNHCPASEATLIVF